MVTDMANTDLMRAVRFHSYGEPGDVLRLDRIAICGPARNRILVRVDACALNPADWALCRGLFADALPRGVGLDVAGRVVSVGEDVRDVTVGQAVFGPADYASYPSAGAADYAVLSHWDPLPQGLSMQEAAALVLVTETAYRSLAWLGLSAGQTVLIHGAGTMVGFAAVQIALARGARVIATAGPTFAERLRDMGALVARYGDGMIERVRAIAGGIPDSILDAGPASGVLPALVAIAGGDATRVLTCTDFAAAAELGVRNGIGEEPTGQEGSVLRYDAVAEFATLAAEGRYSIPIAATFALDEWRAAMAVSAGGHAHGKIVLVP